MNDGNSAIPDSLMVAATRAAAGALTIKFGAGNDLLTFGSTVEANAGLLPDLSAEGGDGADTVVVDADASYELFEDSLSFGGIRIQLSDFSIAKLSAPSPTYFFMDWAGTAYLSGGPGSGVADWTHIPGDIHVSDDRIERGGVGTFFLTNFDDFSVAAESQATVDVTNWSGTGVVGAYADAPFTITDFRNTPSYSLQHDTLYRGPDVGSISVDREATVKLTTSHPNATFTISGFAGATELTSTDGSGKVVDIESVASFTLSDRLLDRGNSIGTAKLSGITAASLSLSKSPCTFDLSDWSGTATIQAGLTLVGQTYFSGTVVATSDVALFELSNTVLKRTGRGDISMFQIGSARLTGGAGPNTFDVSAWTHGGLIDGAAGVDSIISANNVNFTLSPTSLVRGTPLPALPIANIENAYLTAGSSANTFDLSLWTGGGAIDGGGGTDVLITANDVAKFTLSDNLLQRTGLGDVTLASIESATLTGGPSDNAFEVSGWSGVGTMEGLAGNDQIIATNDIDRFDLSFSGLVRTNHGTLALNSIEQAKLTGGANANRFVVTSSVLGATLDGGGGGADTLSATSIGSIVLSDSQFLRDAQPAIALAGIETANITSTGIGARFEVSGWTGAGALTASKADGIVTATNDVDFALSEDLLRRTGHRDLSLKGVHAANLTGGSSENAFDLTGFYGTATIDGAEGEDTFRFTQAGDAALSLTSATTAMFTAGTAHVDVAGVRHYVIEASGLRLTGDETPRVVDWSPQYTGVPSGSMLVSDALGYTRIEYSGGLAFEGLPSLKLLTPAGVDFLLLSAKEGVGTVAKDNSDYAPPQTLATFHNVRDMSLDLGENDTTPASDRVTIDSVAVDGLKNLAIATGRGNDVLYLTYGAADWHLPVAGGAFTFNGGADDDTVTANRLEGSFVLTPSQLSSSSGGALGYEYVETFNLSAPAITVAGTDTEAFVARPTGWQLGTVELPARVAGAGQAVTLHYQGEITLAHAASLQVITTTPNENYRLDALGGAGLLSTNYIFDGSPQVYADTTTFSGIPDVTVDLGAGDGAGAVNRLTVNSLSIEGLAHVTVKGGAGDDTLELAPTLTALLPNRGIAGSMVFDAGAGTDTLEASADVSMYVHGSVVVYQDNTPEHALLGELDLPESAVERFVLMGGASANRFAILSSPAAVTLDAGAGDDSIEFPLLSHFTGTGRFRGGEGNDTFLVQMRYESAIEGAGDGVTLDGGAGLDTIRAQGNIHFHLSDTMLTREIRSRAGSLVQQVTNPIESFEQAILIGGESGNLLDALYFTGRADLAGEGGVDNLIASKGGGALYGFHYGTPALDFERANHKLYTRDNFYASDGTAAAALVELHANDVAGNVISFRYYQSAHGTGVTYALPGAPSDRVSLVSGRNLPALQVRLAEGQLNAVEGSIFADRLTGNSKTNFLVGLGGNDTLTAVGFDYLFGGAGADRFAGITPFKYQDGAYLIPQTTGATAIPIRPLAAHAARGWLDPIAELLARRAS